VEIVLERGRGGSNREAGKGGRFHFVHCKILLSEYLELKK
jgi:hypothetical protein